MTFRRILIAAIAVTCSFSVANTFAGEVVSKPAVKAGAAKVERVRKEPAAAKPAPRAWWRRTADQPCDSSACRPFRFAWSPVAPGA